MGLNPHVMGGLPASVDFDRAVYAILAISAGWFFLLILKWFRARSLLLKQMPRAPGETFFFGHGSLVIHPRSHVLTKEFADKLGPYYYVRILAYHVSRSAFQQRMEVNPTPLRGVERDSRMTLRA